MQHCGLKYILLKLKNEYAWILEIIENILNFNFFYTICQSKFGRLCWVNYIIKRCCFHIFSNFKTIHNYFNLLND